MRLISSRLLDKRTPSENHYDLFLEKRTLEDERLLVLSDLAGLLQTVTSVSLARDRGRGRRHFILLALASQHGRNTAKHSAEDDRVVGTPDRRVAKKMTTTKPRAKRFASVLFTFLAISVCLLLWNPVVAAEAEQTCTSAEAGTCAGDDDDDKKDSSPPGLYTALDDFTPSPKELRRTVCKCVIEGARETRGFWGHVTTLTH